MRKCPQCNNTVDDSFSFCPSCGYDLRKIINVPDSGENDDINIDDKDRQAGKVVLCDVCGEETAAGEGVCESCGAILTGREKEVNTAKSETAKPKAAAPKAEAPKVNAGKEQKKTAIQPPVQKKAKPVPQPVNRQKHKTPEIITAAGSKQAVSPVQIALLVIGLIIVALLVLQMTGVFDTRPVVNSNLQQQGTQADSTGISLDQLNTINAMESTVQKDTTNTENVLQLAHLLNDSGFNEKAIRYYRMYLKSKPEDANAIVDMGVCYFKLKDYITAKVVMRQGLKVNPKHQIALFNLGIINLSAGSPDSAKIWWQKAIDLGPETEIGMKAKQLLNSH